MSGFTDYHTPLNSEATGLFTSLSEFRVADHYTGDLSERIGATSSFATWAVGAIVLGAGTAMVYPTLLAAIGALLAGILADMTPRTRQLRY